MTFLMRKSSIGDKEPKPTGLKKVTKIPASSMPKPQSNASKAQYWGSGIAKAIGVRERIVLLKLPLTILKIFMHRLPFRELMRQLTPFPHG